jgi:hypothetical protein
MLIAGKSRGRTSFVGVGVAVWSFAGVISGSGRRQSEGGHIFGGGLLRRRAAGDRRFFRGSAGMAEAFHELIVE